MNTKWIKAKLAVCSCPVTEWQQVTTHGSFQELPPVIYRSPENAQMAWVSQGSSKGLSWFVVVPSRAGFLSPLFQSVDKIQFIVSRGLHYSFQSQQEKCSILYSLGNRKTLAWESQRSHKGNSPLVSWTHERHTCSFANDKLVQEMSETPVHTGPLPWLVLIIDRIRNHLGEGCWVCQ